MHVCTYLHARDRPLWRYHNIKFIYNSLRTRQVPTYDAIDIHAHLYRILYDSVNAQDIV